MVNRHGRRGGPGSPWIVNLLKRKPPKLAAVALANKMARIAWKLIVTGDSYAAKSAPAGRRGERRIEISQTRGASQL
jgi:transposase